MILPATQAPIPPKTMREERSPERTFPSIITDDVCDFGRKKNFKTSHQLLRTTQEPGVGQR